jgi:hypothetical protein
MFAPLTPMRLQGCNGKTKKDAEGNRLRVVVLTFMLQPFTAEMANDLNVKARLFGVTDGLPLNDIVSTALKVAVPQQRVELYEAPDMPKASVILPDVDVSPVINVRADKEGPVYAATFNVSFAYPSAKDLLWLFQRVTDQAFVTMTSTGQQSLIGEIEEPEPPT